MTRPVATPETSRRREVLSVATPENVSRLLGIEPRQSDNPEPEAQREQPVEPEPERRPDIGAAIRAAKAGEHAELVERLHRPRPEPKAEPEPEPNEQPVNRAEIAALGALEAKRRQALGAIRWEWGDEYR